MKKINFWLILTLALGLALSACSPKVTATPTDVATLAPTEAATTASEPLTFTDGLGRTVTLAAPAQKIVSLAPSTTEMLYAVGAGDQMVGRDSFSNYPEEAATLTDIGGSNGAYSYDSIASLQPDLVVAAAINTEDQVKALTDLGLTVYYVGNPTSMEDLYTSLETIGELTGHMDDAVDLTDSLNTRVQTVLDAVARADSQPVVFYELDGSDPGKPWTSGPGTFLDMLITLAGGKNVGSSLSSAWAQISVEELLTQNPDVILLGDAAYGTTIDTVKAREGWDKIKAVQEGAIYAFNDDLVSRAGPRLVEGLEDLARTIHPELFK
ncbi:MAG: cobalamin-binding protein [Anaerolineaceae bacterium]|nr:cobalamin-binding protein [Anaerolineaceae bacterium]